MSDCVFLLPSLLVTLSRGVEAIMLWVMIVAEVILCGGIALLWAALGRQRFTDAFSWRRPTLAALAGAVLLGLGMVPWMETVVLLQGLLFPQQNASVRAQTEAFVPLMLHHPLLLALGLPISAAISEEMLFRGPVQRALLRRLPVWLALCLGGLIFAALHLDLEGLVARTALGVLLSWVVLRTRSIFPAMLAHFVYDAALLGLGVQQVRGLGANRVLAMTAHPAGMSPAEWVLGPSLGILLVVAGVWLCRRTPSRRASPVPSPREGHLESPSEPSPGSPGAESLTSPSETAVEEVAGEE